MPSRTMHGSAAVAVLFLAVMSARSVQSRVDDAAFQVTGGFVFEQAPFESCHASTIVETTDGSLLCAFFAGREEGDPSVGIWLSRHSDNRWSAPMEVANGIVEGGKRHPCWNPVLFQPTSPGDAPL